MNPKAVFDVGSNSVKMLVAMSGGGAMGILADEVRICGLGKGLRESGALTEASMSRTLDALEELTEMARGLGAREIRGVGTQALRQASNGTAFLDELRTRCAWELTIISGEEEARLSFRAASASLRGLQGDVVTFDVGGGSTEFNFGCHGDVRERVSLPLGCIPLTEDFLADDPPSPESVDSLLDHLRGELSEIEGKDGTLVGIGGTVTTLGSVNLQMERYEGERIRGLKLSSGEVDRQIEIFRSLPLMERRKLLGLHPERAPVILAGACVVRAIMTALEKEELSLSDLALRHGLFLDLYLD